jgi:cell fate (sporulation/competence/biofilm development) regulator YmcA (YheA/YmcA/DUF963 family)
MELAINLNNELKNDAVVVEYLNYKRAINNSNLLNVENDLKQLQKLIVQALDDERMIEYEDYKRKYNELKTSYENNPLYVNYHYSLENVNELLQQIAFIIDKEINN